MMVQMTSTSIPSPLPSCKMLAISPPSIRAAKIAHYSAPTTKFHLSKLSKSIHCQKTSFHSNGSTRTAGVVVACGAGESGPPEDHSALETVLKLYEAIKNRNVVELSDIIAEECLCVSNIISTFQPFFGKKQVLAFFSSLMKNMGNNIEFVVQQTSDDGMVVGVSWKLEWNKVRVPLGKGFSVCMCHVYQGKVMIKNVEIFLEPILHIEPLRLKVIPLVMTAVEKLNPVISNNKTRRAIVLFFILLLLLAALLFIFKYRTLT